jgi:O-antigen/teichoic acid export membrane protein
MLKILCRKCLCVCVGYKNSRLEINNCILKMKISGFIKALGAHGYGQCVTILANFITPSLLIYAWGGGGFGYWMSLTAAAQVCTMFDLGISQAIGNYLCLSCANNNRLAASTYRYTVKVIKRRLYFGFFVSFVLSGAYAISVKGSTSFFDTIFLGILLCVISMTQVPVQLLIGIERYNDKYPWGVFISNTVRLLEVLVALFSIYICSLSMMAYAAVVAIFRVFVIYIWYLWQQKVYKEIFLNKNENEDNALKLNEAGFGFAKINVAAILSIQAPIYFSSMFLGPAFTAVLAATRTVSRVPSQLCLLFNLSVGPDLTKCYQRKDIVLFKKITLRFVIVFFAITLFWAYFLEVNIKWIEVFWLHNKIHIPGDVLIAMVASTLFNVISQVLVGAITATNKTKSQGKYSVCVLGIYLVAMLLALIMFSKNIFLLIVVVYELVCVLQSYVVYKKQIV